MEGRSHSSEREEDHDLFPIYSERSQQDMTAMVSALTQVIGGSNNDSLQLHGEVLTSSHNTSTQNNEQSQVSQEDQGKFNCAHTHLYYSILFITYNLLRSNWT